MIPRFCYNNNLSVAGNCRICMVELKNSAKPVTSCTTNIMDKMVIFTDSPLVRKARENIMEFLLLNHPLDCPICDQGGECDLQDLSLNFGSDRSRFFNFKRVVEDKYCGPIIKTIMTRCIHCTKCVRFLQEVCNYPLYGTVGRGTHTEISTFLEKNLNNELSGNLIDLCPVGALTSKVETFLYRPWELNRVESVDFHDPIGSTVSVYTRNINFVKDFTNTFFSDVIIRILPKPNFWINMDWLTDKSRFSYKTVYQNRNFYLLEKTGHKTSWYKFMTELIAKKPLAYYDKKKQNFISNFIFQYYGLFLDAHSLIFSNFTFKLLGQNNWFINNKSFKLNIDVPYFYRFNSWINNLNTYNIFILFNTDIRYESPILHLYCRKTFLNKNSFFFIIGNFFNSFFPFYHLGSSIKILYDILEGRHKLCCYLRKFKQIILIKGNNYIYKNKSRTIFRMMQFFLKKSFLNLKNFINYNFLLNNTTKTNIAEVGLYNSNNNWNFNKKKFYDEKIIIQDKFAKHFVFQDNIAIEKLYNKLTISQYIYNFSSYNQKNKNFLIPTKTLYEKTGFLFNIQGRIRYFRQSLTSYGMATGIDDFFRVLYFFFHRVKKKEYIFEKIFQPLFFLQYYPWLFKKFIKDMDAKLKKKLKIKQTKQILVSQYTNAWTKGFFCVLFSSLFITSKVLIKQTSFFKLIKNFYTDNYLSANSDVLMQAFLLQKHGINFSQKKICF